MRELGTLGAYNSPNAAYGINNVGQVIGESGSAFLWDSTNGMHSLADLFGGPGRSSGFDINDVGQIVGYGLVPGTVPHAFLWDAAHGALDLGELPGGREESNAQAINNAGQVVGYSYAATGSRAFLWNAADGMRDINSLLDATGTGWVLGEATDINELGWIVGSGTNPQGLGRGFLLVPVPEPASLCLFALGGLSMLRRQPARSAKRL